MMNADINDSEIEAFIRSTEKFYEGENFEDISAQRRCYNRMCAAFSRPHPSGVTTSDSTIPSGGLPLKIRTYTLEGSQSEHATVYYHGGGYVLGDLESHDSICADICARTSMTVIAVDYRLAPEYHFPDDLEDAISAFDHASSKHNGVILAGDSAGGNLVAAVSIATREREARPSGQVLIYPALGGELLGLESYTVNANAPLLKTEEVSFYLDARSPDPAARNDPLFSPLLCDNLQDLPPCVVFSAGLDPVRDDGHAYASRLRKEGIDATSIDESNLPHGYLRARHQSSLAGASFARICDAIVTMAESGRR